jgi:hypothetical protein
MTTKAEASGEGTLAANPVVPDPAAIVVAPQDTGPTPTPPSFTTGWVKQDPATLAVAVRTEIPDPYLDHEWGVMTIDRGGHYASYDEVQSWTDLTTGP